jgi:hypothetical protein
MRFGRVDGFLRQGPDGALFLTVNLDSGREIRVVREGVVARLRPIESDADLRWHVDQYTQETIAVDLAEQGWEVFAEGETPPSDDSGLIRSVGYLVRLV